MDLFRTGAYSDLRALRRASGDRLWSRWPRSRRRAAVRAAWHRLERRPAESWPEFWRAELASRQA